MATETTTERRFDPWDTPTITAQDVVDALRLAFMSQKDAVHRAAIADVLLEFAPETDNNRGTALLLRLITEGTLKLQAVEDSTP